MTFTLAALSEIRMGAKLTRESLLVKAPGNVTSHWPWLIIAIHKFQLAIAKQGLRISLSDEVKSKALSLGVRFAYSSLIQIVLCYPLQ